jgi:hypothetical protein
MVTKIQLHEMSYSEKLELFNALCDDLAKMEEQLPPPDWHKEILEERERRIETGEEPSIDWETAKKELRKQISRGRKP